VRMVSETPELAGGTLPPEMSSATSVWHCFLLREAAQRVTAMAEEMLQPQGLTVRHLGVLGAIEAEPGQNQRGVGERLRIDRTTVVALTDDLEGAGLLERRRGSDRRMFALFLTSAGQVRLAELKELIAAVHEKFLVNLSEDERDILHGLLVRVLAGN
jgi:MarR family transcriptional regulator, lower aerobic nicotinate degradation pathway regulator